MGWFEGVFLDSVLGIVFIFVGVEEFFCFDFDFLFLEGVVFMLDGVLVFFVLIEFVLVLFLEFLWFCLVTIGEVVLLVVFRIRLRFSLFVFVFMIIIGFLD